MKCVEASEVTLSKIFRHNPVVLDEMASAVLSSVLTTQGNLHVISIEKCTNEVQSCRMENPAFLIFMPLTKRILDLLAYVFIRHQLDSVRVFTPLPAYCNAELQEFSAGCPDYPTHPVQFRSPKFGIGKILIERLPFFTSSVIPDVFTFPKDQEITEDGINFDEPFNYLNLLLSSIKAIEEVYSLGRFAQNVASQFGSRFTPCGVRKKCLSSAAEKCSASVVFISDLALIDPVANIEPYTKPNHLLDLIFSELSPNGHCVRVFWDDFSSLPKLPDDETRGDQTEEPFYTNLLQKSYLGPHRLLGPQLMHKEQEALSTLQHTILKIAEQVQHPLPELSKAPQTRAQWAELFRSQAKELFNPMCSSGKFELLDAIQLAVAASLALSASAKRARGEPKTMTGSTSEKHTVSLEKLLTRFERSLLVASQLDAKLVSELETATKCEPILLQALAEARKLTYLDDMFFLVTHLLSLMPVQSTVSEAVWSGIKDLFSLGCRSRDPKQFGFAAVASFVPTYMTAEKLVANLRALREERRKLPSYNNLWVPAQPRYRSPIVQLLKDLLVARDKPEEASPSLKGLTHHKDPASAGNWLGGWSKYIHIPGSPQENLPCCADYVILVLLGHLPFALARDLFETLNAHYSTSPSANPLKLRIVANAFTGGISGLSGFFSIN
ncbi:unnamed protein product [Calicophoron daubneyi]|uniref:Sec1 family domain-containing protein 2 n=1 Tax=Calicophoron daubneyi TaxID=300641 RepID=A0AAV2TAB6_CALDB